jgi:hypothetical protein
MLEGSDEVTLGKYLDRHDGDLYRTWLELKIDIAI